MVLPLVSFDCLLGMSWISAVGANLDVEHRCILYGQNKYFYWQLLIPEPKHAPAKISLYADKSITIALDTFGEIPVTSFN